MEAKSHPLLIFPCVCQSCVFYIPGFMFFLLGLLTILRVYLLLAGTNPGIVMLHFIELMLFMHCLRYRL